MNYERTVTGPITSLQPPPALAPVMPAASDDQETVSLYKRQMGSDPSVGWLVCVEGPHFGEDYRLKSGRNAIGRSAGMDVAITNDMTVSREKHAVVVFEPKTCLFMVMPGESKELCYLNNDVVMAPREIQRYDRLTVGSTTLMFINCCGPAFSWEKARR